MDLYPFNFQDMQGRTALIWKHDTFICFREEGKNTVALYDMGKFFAEVWYNAEMNEIKRVKGFKSLQCLEPYSVAIKITGITLI
jgi:hypothetical protein